MDEETDKTYFEGLTPDMDGSEGVEGDDVPVTEWVVGLPSSEDLATLSQRLVSPELASAFGIQLPGVQTLLDVQRAAQQTISNISGHQNKSLSSPPAPFLKPFTAADNPAEETMLFEPDDLKESSTLPKVAQPSDHMDGSTGAMPPTEALEGDSSSIPAENSMDENSGRMLKRSRLVWTPQLHKRFVDVVAHLGIKNAVPKTIMQLMNVDGLTRENVASHLQKYRLYLKRVHGFSIEDPSLKDNLFASMPVPQSLQEQQISIHMPYSLPAMFHMPVYGLPHQHAHGLGPVNNHQGVSLCNGYESHRIDAPDDWSGGNKFAPIISYPHVSPSAK